MVKVKHMGSTNQNNSIHWFNLNAVQIRVLGNHLDNTRPTKPVLEMENVDFLPSPADNQNYLHDITAIATRVVIKHIPAFNIFKDVTVHHIPHKYSEVMKQKSQQVPLGLLFKNENVNEEMIDILQQLHNKYLPVDRDEIDGQEVVTILERLFFGGDQLTNERANNCKDARSDGDTQFEWLEGFFQ
ncbi:hypothetical protein OS493_035651 [Desmophyllum pertusum]|uniref:DUF6589 domain-containing protein n=1 Tax=Desmophyllum pertusum TaxID=174260 RepID=A0A9X0CUQ4_9CNID|nr:hypothetical protein OS493_035651 [Desmophyllum pertusum]